MRTRADQERLAEIEREMARLQGEMLERRAAPSTHAAHERCRQVTRRQVLLDVKRDALRRTGS